MKLVAFSRRFPPNYKRRWYICLHNGWYIVRQNNRTWQWVRFPTRNDALNMLGV